MQRIFWVKNGELDKVNEWLQKGGKVKMIQPVSEIIAAYGYHASYPDTNSFGCKNEENHGYYVGDIYAYVVVEFD